MEIVDETKEGGTNKKLSPLIIKIVIVVAIALFIMAPFVYDQFGKLDIIPGNKIKGKPTSLDIYVITDAEIESPSDLRTKFWEHTLKPQPNISVNYMADQDLVIGKVRYLTPASALLGLDDDKQCNRFLDSLEHFQANHETSGWLFIARHDTYIFGDRLYGHVCELTEKIDPMKKIHFEYSAIVSEDSMKISLESGVLMSNAAAKFINDERGQFMDICTANDVEVALSDFLAGYQIEIETFISELYVPEWPTQLKKAVDSQFSIVNNECKKEVKRMNGVLTWKKPPLTQILSAAAPLADNMELSKQLVETKFPDYLSIRYVDDIVPVLCAHEESEDLDS